MANYYGQDIDNEEPIDPLWYEAREHADAALGWMEDEARLNLIPWADYNKAWSEELGRQYERLVAERKADLEARKCECGGYFEYAGVWTCDKCGKNSGEPFDLDIPF